jgi:acetyl esterase/lipase
MRFPLIFGGALLGASMLLAGCLVNQNNLGAAEKLSTSAPTPVAPTRNNVLYGPESHQHLDIYQPDGTPRGTIVFFHAGGWCCGDEDDVDALILSQVTHGFAVVSVHYGLALEETAEEMNDDADRSIRWVKVHEVEWGAQGKPVIAAGGSAGGNVALLMGSAPGVFVESNLPADLAATSPNVDGVISFVGPSDLRPYVNGQIPPAGLDGQQLVEDYLDCSNRGSFKRGTTTPMPACTELRSLLFSPLFWASLHMWDNDLPPVYLGYGVNDALVPPSSQALPIADVWAMSAGSANTWLDLANSTHNVTFELNATAFNRWMNRFN